VPADLETAAKAVAADWQKDETNILAWDALPEESKEMAREQARVVLNAVAPPQAQQGQCCEKASGPGAICPECAAASAGYSAAMAPAQAQQKTVCPYCQSEWVTGDQHDANLAAHLEREAQAQQANIHARTSALEAVRIAFAMERTPAYGDALALCRALEKELAQVQQAAPLTDEQIEDAALARDNEHAFVAGFHSGARFAEHTCAEAWGVKLTGIGAGSKESGNG
jgi:hypothetical protein